MTAGEFACVRRAGEVGVDRLVGFGSCIRDCASPNPDEMALAFSVLPPRGRRRPGGMYFQETETGTYLLRRVRVQVRGRPRPAPG